MEYLIFGSMAKSHFRPLPSVGNMDLLINPTRGNAKKLKLALDRIYGSMARCTVEDLAEPGKHLYLGRDYKDYLNVDFFTAKREFDFLKAFSRSITVEIADGIQAHIACEADLEILDLFNEEE